jgi:hypothetical protein
MPRKQLCETLNVMGFHKQANEFFVCDFRSCLDSH